MRGLCATLLGICIAYHDGSSASYTKYVKFLMHVCDQLEYVVYGHVTVSDLGFP